jgi:hypothetical protein
MLVVVYHFRNSLSVPSLHMEPIGCPETSVNKCQLASRNVSEERRPHLNDCRSLKSVTDFFVRHTPEQKFPSATLVKKKVIISGFFPAERLYMTASVNKKKLMCAPGLQKFSRSVGMTSAFHTSCSDYL